MSTCIHQEEMELQKHDQAMPRPQFSAQTQSILTLDQNIKDNNKCCGYAVRCKIITFSHEKNTIKKIQPLE